jgi:hypothetical protein
MLIAGVAYVCAALASAVSGLCTLTRPRPSDPSRLVVRAVAPAQLAAAVMLAVGGAVALTGPSHGVVVVLLVCTAGAVGTLAAGSWQGARYAARRQTVSACAGSCGACTLSCR